MMRKIMVATDFSTRSDRALRRATLLARHATARLLLVHVVDDDQPMRLVEAGQREALLLLTELARTIHDVDGLDCDAKVILGEPFQGISGAATELDVNLVVMGPYRRQVLREIFMGTTAERTIRRSRRPILMANAVPAQLYRRILVAADFSDSSVHALQTARSLGFFEDTEVILLHVFDTLAQDIMLRAAMTREQLMDHVAEEEAQAAHHMVEFIGKVQFKPSRRILRPVDESTAQTIKDCALAERVDLVVMGTQGQSGVGRLLLGSVAESVMQGAEMDVLAIPLDQSPDAGASS
jgi:nucleotide-binding universal stress UspA family protein